MKYVSLFALFFITPLFAWGYSVDDIDRLELHYNPQALDHDLLLVMSDGETLVSNLTVAASSKYHAYHRIFSIVKNTEGFDDITQEEVEMLFDWRAFVEKRILVRLLIDQALKQDISLLEKLKIEILRKAY